MYLNNYRKKIESEIYYCYRIVIEKRSMGLNRQRLIPTEQTACHKFCTKLYLKPFFVFSKSNFNYQKSKIAFWHVKILVNLYNKQIEGLNKGINGECIDKVCGYADDIVFIIKE